MTLVEMLYYQAACKYKNFTKAAESLHVTQSAISIAMRNLEDECRVSLFIRSRNQIEITDEGQVLLDEIEKVLQQYDHLMHVITELNLTKKYIRLGLSTLTGNLVYPQILQKFQQKHGDIEVISTEASSKKLFELLDAGQLDVIITAHTFDDQGISDAHPLALYHHIPLAETSTYFCVGKANPLSKESTISLERIAEEPLVMQSDNFSQTIRIKKLFEERHLSYRVIHYTNQMYTVERFIEQNVAAGFLPKIVAINNPDIRAIPFVDEKRYVELFWRKNQHLFSATKSFIQLAKSYYKSNITQ